jgi:hypothetical protein
VKVKGMVRVACKILPESSRCQTLIFQVTDVFTIRDYQKALDKMNSRGALKIAVKPY